MNQTSKIIVTSLVLSLFSLFALQSYRKINQFNSNTQVLGDTTVKSVPCSLINTWQQQYCSLTVLPTPTTPSYPTPTPITPTPSPYSSSVIWVAPDNTRFTASSMTLKLNDKTYTGKPESSNPVSVGSNITGTYDMNLESRWTELGDQLHFKIYFHTDSVYWWISQIEAGVAGTGSSIAYFSNNNVLGVKKLIGQELIINGSNIFSGYYGINPNLTISNIAVRAFTSPPPQPTPTTAMYSCTSLQIKYQYDFNKCANSGYDRICFNKFTAEYLGCFNSSNNICTLNNDKAVNNIACTTNIAPIPTNIIEPTSPPPYRPTATPTPIYRPL